MRHRPQQQGGGRPFWEGSWRPACRAQDDQGEAQLQAGHLSSPSWGDYSMPNSFL